MFSNTKINGYLTSKYISSWVKAGGELTTESYDMFREWLESLGLNYDEVTHIIGVAYLGSDVLRNSAKKFINAKKEEVAC